MQLDRNSNKRSGILALIGFMMLLGLSGVADSSGKTVLGFAAVAVLVVAAVLGSIDHAREKKAASQPSSSAPPRPNRP